MDKNVMIPSSLMDMLIELLGNMDIQMHDIKLRADRCDALDFLERKKHRAKLRDDYAKIIFADNDEDRDWARINYLQRKQAAHDDFF